MYLMITEVLSVCVHFIILTLLLVTYVQSLEMIWLFYMWIWSKVRFPLVAPYTLGAYIERAGDVDDARRAWADEGTEKEGSEKKVPQMVHTKLYVVAVDRRLKLHSAGAHTREQNTRNNRSSSQFARW